MRSPRVQISRSRLGIARALMLIPFAILALRAAHLSVDERGLSRGIVQTQRTMKLAAERGAILDAAGVELALSVDSPSIYAIPSSLRDLDTAVERLAPVLGWREETLRERLQGRSSFGFLSRWVTPERARRVEALGLRGIGVVDEPRRVYPHRRLGAQLIGFANIDGAGVRGVEQQEDEWLRGVERRIPVERDARGRLLWMTGSHSWDTSGGDIALTIDATLQAAAERALNETVEARKALGGVVIVMDPWTGDILTLAENPGFDPNQFRKLHFPATRSRAFHDALDPGSTMKAFLVAAALEIGSLSGDDLFDCENGAFRVPGKTIRDHHPHGMLDPATILQVSSNIGAVKIAYQIGPSAHFEMLARFGFGHSTQSRFPEESAGVMRPWQDWQPVDHATIAFGQGINVTPIQLAAATAALANGGTLMQPRLVSGRRAPSGDWHATPVSRVRRVVSERTARDILQMLEGVVDPDGTASRAGLRGVRVAGKTGTAQKWDVAAKTYSQDRYGAWFIGVVPADDPKLAIVVAIDEPARPRHTGGAAAAPLFARVAADHLSRFGIRTTPQRRRADPTPTETPTLLVADSDRDRKDAALPRVSAPPPSAGQPRTRRSTAPMQTPIRRGAEFAQLDDRILLPDFLGLTVAEVRQITAEGPLTVQISGRGRAVQQDPPPGSIVALGTNRVQIRFESATPARREGES
jgi:cell division protein FtsI (penicillin-binding protein 3)